MECKFCGEALRGRTNNGKPRLFCDRGCHEAWKAERKAMGVSASRPYLALDPREKKRRKALISAALSGDESARGLLKKGYGLTALWDGKGLVRL